MALSRLASYTRSEFRVRICNAYNIKNSKCRIFGAEKFSTHAEESNIPERNESLGVVKNSTDRRSNLEMMKRLNTMKSKMRELHGLTETSKLIDVESRGPAVTNELDMEFDVNCLGRVSDALTENAGEQTRNRERAFIESLKNPHPDKVPNTIIAPFGKIRRDVPFSGFKIKKRDSIELLPENENDIYCHLSREDTSIEVSRIFSGSGNKTPEKEAQNSVDDRQTSSANYFDKQYFDLSDKAKVANIDESVRSDDSFIESQFFTSEAILNQPQHKDFGESVCSASSRDGSSRGFGDDPVSKKAVDCADGEPNFFDQSYFSNLHGGIQEGSNILKKKIPSTPTERSSSRRKIQKFVPESIEEEEEDDYENEDSDLMRCAVQALDNFQPGVMRESEVDNTVRIENLTRKERKAKDKELADTENPKTAYDAVAKMRKERKEQHMSRDGDQETDIKKGPRKWEGKVDSKGFRILTDQVQDVQQMIDSDLVSMLCDSVIFENGEVIAINKPYGLPSHGGPGVVKSMASLIEKVVARREKDNKTYHIVHRLDKDTTGVMLLAKTEKTAYLLTDMFKKREVIKVYWAITKGVPNPPEGIIDIPIGEGMAGQRYRMELRPKYHPDIKLLRKSVDNEGIFEAQTQYRILEQTDHCALVECRPKTGVKHQIRCHLSFALNTPILGDHKYSHHSKLAPQRLPEKMLDRLGVRQAKVRHLSMHLHAKTLVLPEFLEDGRNLSISCRLPKHFVQNMKWLKLRFPNF